MASWLPTCLMYLWILVRSGELSPVAPPPFYNVYNNSLSFDQAAKTCFPGVLTTLATEKEVAQVLGRVSALVSPGSQFTFWVGLKKVKDQCVVPMKPLRGFRWLEDDGERSEVNRWSTEPQDTCTTVRCAALQGEVRGSGVTRWGLIPLSCKSNINHQFICKHTVGGPAPAAEDLATTTRPAGSKPSKPATHKPASAGPEPTKPATHEPGPAGPEPTKPAEARPTEAEETSPAPPEPKPGPTAPVPSQPRPAEPEATKPEPNGPTQGPEVGPPGGRPGRCPKPNVPGARFIRLGSENSSKIQVECWTVRLELHCDGGVAAWRLPDQSVANFTTICEPCGAGYVKDPSAHCVDLDECGGGAAPCRHTCLNTQGSFRCVCSDQDGNQHDDGSVECAASVPADDGEASPWDILLPVLVAVAILVAVVVLVAVTVKCCLMKREKKKKSQEEEEVAMKNNE